MGPRSVTPPDGFTLEPRTVTPPEGFTLEQALPTKVDAGATYNPNPFNKSYAPPPPGQPGASDTEALTLNALKTSALGVLRAAQVVTGADVWAPGGGQWTKDKLEEAARERQDRLKAYGPWGRGLLDAGTQGLATLATLPAFGFVGKFLEAPAALGEAAGPLANFAKQAWNTAPDWARASALARGAEAYGQDGSPTEKLERAGKAFTDELLLGHAFTQAEGAKTVLGRVAALQGVGLGQTALEASRSGEVPSIPGVLANQGVMLGMGAYGELARGGAPAPEPGEAGQKQTGALPAEVSAVDEWLSRIGAAKQEPQRHPAESLPPDLLRSARPTRPMQPSDLATVHARDFGDYARMGKAAEAQDLGGPGDLVALLRRMGLSQAEADRLAAARDPASRDLLAKALGLTSEPTAKETIRYAYAGRGLDKSLRPPASLLEVARSDSPQPTTPLSSPEGGAPPSPSGSPLPPLEPEPGVIVPANAGMERLGQEPGNAPAPPDGMAPPEDIRSGLEPSSPPPPEERRTSLDLRQAVEAAGITPEQIHSRYFSDQRTGIRTRAAYDLLDKQGAFGGLHHVYFDGEGIKAINDTHGHDAGDSVIDAIAKTVRDVYGDQLSYRANLSGDEFLGLHADPAQAEAMAREVQRRLAGMRVKVGTPNGTQYIEGVGVRYGAGKTRAEADAAANAARVAARQPVPAPSGGEHSAIPSPGAGAGENPERGDARPLRGVRTATQGQGEGDKQGPRIEVGGAVHGNDTALYVRGGKSYPATYALVEASSLKPDTPEGQNRNSNSAVAKVGPRGQDFIPEAVLSDTPFAQDGPPTVLQDGMVVGGNTRLKGTLHSIEVNAPKAAEYRAALRARLPRFGIDPAAAEKMQAPVLVRVVKAPDTRLGMDTLVGEINQSTTTPMTATETAAQDARILPDTFLDSFQVGEGESFSSAIRRPVNAQARNTLVMTLFPEAARAVDVGARLTPLMLKRMEAAALAKGLRLGRDSMALDMMLESPDVGMNTVRNALVDKAGVLAKANSYQDSRAVEGDPMGDLSAAVEKFASLKHAGRDPAEFASQAQASIFGAEAEKEGLSDKAVELVGELSELSRSRKKLADFLDDYAKQIINAPDKHQTGLFSNPSSTGAPGTELPGIPGVPEPGLQEGSPSPRSALDPAVFSKLVADHKALLDAAQKAEARMKGHPPNSPLSRLARDKAQELRNAYEASLAELAGTHGEAVANSVRGMAEGTEERLQGGFGAVGGAGKAAFSLLQAAHAQRVPVLGEVAPATAKLLSGAADVKEDIQKTFGPQTLSEPASVAANVIRYRNAEKARRMEQATVALKETGKLLRKLPTAIYPAEETAPLVDLGVPKDQAGRVAFIQRMETGKPQPTPELDSAASALRGLLDSTWKQVQDAKGTDHFLRNYFPHIWADPEAAEQAMGRILGRRPLQGPMSFFKRRTMPTTMDGLKAGLSMATTDPVEMTLLKVHEMNRFLMGDAIVKDLKARGMMKYFAAGQRPDPALGLAPINDRVGTVYGPPSLVLKEYHDAAVYDGLENLARSIGVKHERLLHVRQALGRAYKGQDRIETQFATPEDVLAHEIGHQLDWKYQLWARMTEDIEGFGSRGNQTKAATQKRRGQIQRELRALMELTKGPDGWKAKKEEKMATILEAYIHAPDTLRETAPTVYEEFMRFLRAEPSVGKLINGIHPSLEHGARAQEVPIPGIRIMGQYYAPKEVTRVLDNFLSPGLSGNPIFDAWRGIGNTLNQASLGVSGFHLLFTANDAAVSRMALGIEQALQGKGVEAVKSLMTTPVSPVTNIRKGHALYRAYVADQVTDPRLAQMVDALVQAGGRVKMDSFYKNNNVEAFVRALKEDRYAAAALRLLPAGIETLAKPVMEWVVPRQKLGVFFDLASHELARLGPDAGEDATRAALAKAWDSIDNRMGQLVYDNLFWSRAVKDLGMASVRSLGWNLGTVRELGGAVVDTVKALTGEAKKGQPVFTHRMAYAVALPILTGIQGAILTYLFTGHGPQALKDYWLIPTGKKNPDGSDERIVLPSYMKDVIAVGTGFDRGVGTGVKNLATMVGHKLHPLASAVMDMLRNEDFYGTEIAHPGDALGRQVLDELGYLGKQAVPFSMRGYQQRRLSGEGPAKAAGAFLGINPAPAYLTRSPAQKQIRDFLSENMPKGARTHEEADASAIRKTLLAGLRNREPGASDHLVAALRSGKVTLNQARDLIKRSKEDPMVYAFTTLHFDQAMRVMDLATPEEKARLIRPLIMKWVRLAKTNPGEAGQYRDAILKLRDEYSHTPVRPPPGYTLEATP